MPSPETTVTPERIRLVRRWAEPLLHYRINDDQAECLIQILEDAAAKVGGIPAYRCGHE